MLPSGTSGQEPSLWKAKNWHKDCESRTKRMKISFGTFLISSLAPEPPGYTRFTFSSLFSLRRMTRNPHLGDEGRAPWALLWVGNLAGLLELQPL